jgi:hypothetical protein
MNIIEKTLLDLEQHINNNKKDYPFSNIEKAIKNAIENDGLIIEKLLSRYFEHINYKTEYLVKTSIALLYTGLYNSELEKIYYNLSLTSRLTTLPKVKKIKIVCYFAGGIYCRDYKNVIGSENLLYGSRRIPFLYEHFKYTMDFSSKYFNTYIMNGINSRYLMEMPDNALSAYIKTLYKYDLISLKTPFTDTKNYPINKSITILSALLEENKSEIKSFYNNPAVIILLDKIISDKNFTNNAIKLINNTDISVQEQIYLKAELYKTLVVKSVEQNVKIEELSIDNYLNVFLSEINYPTSHFKILKDILKDDAFLELSEIKSFMDLLYKKLDYLPMLIESTELHNIITNDIIVKNKTKRL